MEFQDLQVYQYHRLYHTGFWSRATARPQKCHLALKARVLSMTATLYSTCKATRGLTDRTWVSYPQKLQNVLPNVLPCSSKISARPCFNKQSLVGVILRYWSPQSWILSFIINNRHSWQLLTSFQHHAVHVLQRQQCLQFCLPQWLLLLADHTRAHAHEHGGHHRREHQTFH